MGPSIPRKRKISVVNDDEEDDDSVLEVDLLKDSSYDSSTKALNEVITRLRDCGTEQVLSLPKIAVVGSQSAGKSSLIEAISQIKVPRASGTCTRCPMEVILRRGPAASWHCKVSLRLEYDASGNKLGIPTVFFFGETDAKEKVTNLLRFAQWSILNESETRLSYDQLVSEKRPRQKPTLLFSRNLIVLEISGANIDITFIDLPGIISNVEKVLPLT
jgi:hypothetical protein